MPGGFSLNVLMQRLVWQLGPMLLWWWATGRPALLRRLQVIGLLACLCTGFSVVAIIALARSVGTPVRYEGIVLLVVFIYACGGLRLRMAALAGWSITLFYMASETWAGLAHGHVLMRGVFLLTANLIGTIGCATMEYSTRRNFLMQHQLDQLAHQDPLTGTLNRRALDVHLAEMWRKGQADGEWLHGPHSRPRRQRNGSDGLNRGPILASA